MGRGEKTKQKRIKKINLRVKEREIRDYKNISDREDEKKLKKKKKKKKVDKVTKDNGTKDYDRLKELSAVT